MTGRSRTFATIALDGLGARGTRRELASRVNSLRHPRTRRVGDVLGEGGRDAPTAVATSSMRFSACDEPRIVAGPHQLAGQQPGGRLTQHDRIAILSDERRVLAEDRRRRRRCTSRPWGRRAGRPPDRRPPRPRSGREHAGRDELLDALADPRGELARRLAGEGEAEHLGRPHVPLASSQITRFAIVSVLPLPAPAMTSAGSSGASMTAICCSVGRSSPSSRAISTASITGHRPHPVQPQPRRGAESAELLQLVDSARELRGGDDRPAACRMRASTASEPVGIELRLDALAVALAAPCPRGREQQLRAASG